MQTKSAYTQNYISTFLVWSYTIPRLDLVLSLDRWWWINRQRKILAWRCKQSWLQKRGTTWANQRPWWRRRRMSFWCKTRWAQRCKEWSQRRCLQRERNLLFLAMDQLKKRICQMNLIGWSLRSPKAIDTSTREHPENVNAVTCATQRSIQPHTLVFVIMWDLFYDSLFNYYNLRIVELYNIFLEYIQWNGRS